jgi:hypothetical protein
MINIINNIITMIIAVVVIKLVMAPQLQSVSLASITAAASPTGVVQRLSECKLISVKGRHILALDPFMVTTPSQGPLAPDDKGMHLGSYSQKIADVICHRYEPQGTQGEARP